MGCDNLVSERAGFEYLGLVGSGFYHKKGLLCLVRMLHVVRINVRIYVLHLCEHAIKFLG